MGLTNMYNCAPSTGGLGEIVGMLPIVPVYDENGKRGYGIGNAETAFTTSHNIVAEADPEKSWSKREALYLRGNAWAQVRLPIKGLSYKLNLGANIMDNHTRSSSVLRHGLFQPEHHVHHREHPQLRPRAGQTYHQRRARPVLPEQLLPKFQLGP